MSLKMNKSINEYIYRFKYIHFIGIGGVGLSSLSMLLYHKKKFIISGSDIKASEYTKYLSKYNINIFFKHRKENIPKVSKNSLLCIYTYAIDKKYNPEYLYAIRNNIPILSRAELLNILSLEYKYRIAITGTHGKTTITSIISYILIHSKSDPTLCLGGTIPIIKKNYLLGSNNIFVYEACEAFGSLNYYSPNFLIIANIHLDHIDYFKNISNVITEFLNLILRIPNYGCVLINIDDKNSLELLERYYKIKIKNHINIFKISIKNTSADIYTSDIYKKNNSSSFIINSNFTIHIKKLKSIVYNNTFKFDIPLVGTHNIYNFIFGFSIVKILNEFDNQKNHLLNENKYLINIAKKLSNSNRRLELIKSIDNMKVFLDYSHHSNEVDALIDSINQMINKNNNIRVTIVFQAHLESRLQLIYLDLARIFSKCNFNIVLLPLYSARHKLNTYSKSNYLLLFIYNFLIQSHDYNKSCLLTYNNDKINEILNSFYTKYYDNIFIFVGAGDINNLSYKFINSL